MSPVADLLRRAGEWLVEPAEPAEHLPAPSLSLVPPRAHPVIAVVGLARRCGATTLARALAAELAAREDGSAVAASPTRPSVVALGSSGEAVRLAQSLGGLEHVRPAGRLCLATCADPVQLAAATRTLAPAVTEVGPGNAALEAAAEVDQTILVAAPDQRPELVAAVAQTIARESAPPIVVVNRAIDHGPWLTQADVLVPDSRVGARHALSGREPRGWLGKSIEHLADLCAAC